MTKKAKVYPLFGFDEAPEAAPVVEEAPQRPPKILTTSSGFNPQALADALAEVPAPPPPPPPAPDPPPVIAAPVVIPPVEERRTAPRLENEATGMQPTALTFLDDPLARRLAVAWVSCYGDEDAWADATGVSPHDQQVKRMMKALRVNRICRDGGTTDTMALQYITRILASKIKETRPKEKDKK